MRVRGNIDLRTLETDQTRHGGVVVECSFYAAPCQDPQERFCRDRGNGWKHSGCGALKTLESRQTRKAVTWVETFALKTFETHRLESWPEHGGIAPDRTRQGGEGLW